MSFMMSHMLVQHLIDPSICIRCNTCEETCPVGAITHDDNNYVVDASRCNSCRACVAPCPTGAVDRWLAVEQPYSTQEQFAWMDLPEATSGPATGQEADATGASVAAIAPLSAASPTLRLYARGNPAIATLLTTKAATQADSGSEVRHLVLDFGSQPMPVLEGQSIGIIAPGVDERGRPHIERLYSVASARGGERPGTNTVALSVKREPAGVCSNFLCDLKPGDAVQAVGPFGETFLMPEDPASHLIMVCTGTGVAPFRGFIEQRLRTMREATGELLVFFGGRRPQELPYFGEQENLPEGFLEHYICFSRHPEQPREYVQDRILLTADRLRRLLLDPAAHVFLCGRKGMEAGVEEAFGRVLEVSPEGWQAQRARMRATGRYHVETY